MTPRMTSLVTTATATPRATPTPVRVVISNLWLLRSVLVMAVLPPVAACAMRGDVLVACAPVPIAPGLGLAVVCQASFSLSLGPVWRMALVYRRPGEQHQRGGHGQGEDGGCYGLPPGGGAHGGSRPDRPKRSLRPLEPVKRES